jgi:hypothetical protein
MRIWSLHPAYLDPKGLVALWRESLLALHVLRGQTKGYTQHPQLCRFKQLEDPVGGILFYLSIVLEEALRRGYRFDGSKIGEERSAQKLPVTSGQILFEQQHLERKLLVRAPDYLPKLSEKPLLIHPLFFEIEGDLEPWEIR